MSHRRSSSAVVATLFAGITFAGFSLLTGCSLSPSLPASGPAPATGPVSITGAVHGGQNPIYNSTIVLWQAGTTGTTPGGYGANATSLMKSGSAGVVKTAINGTFTLTGTYNACTTGSELYVTAYGGDPSDTSMSINNTNIMLVAALGLCQNLTTSTSIQINEVTTVAAAFGLGQFFGGFGTATGTGDLIGAPSTNTKGLINAFATTGNLVNTSTGMPASTTVPSSPGGAYMTGNDQQKLNTEANIIADCVNQTTVSNTPCTNLYAAVTPTSATAPADTFQAAVYLSLNPTSTNASSSSTNMTTLFNQQSAFAPFSPALTAAPNDWTLALSYDSSGIDDLADAAVDANGDIWFVNGNASGTNGGGFVVLNGGTGAAGGTAGVTGGQIGYYTSGTYGSSPVTTATVNAPRKVAIDENGYAWTANDSSTYYVFKAQSGTGIVGSFTVGSGPTALYGVAVDPTSDNIYVDGSGNAVSVLENAANGSATTITASVVGSATAPGLLINASGTAYQAIQSSSLYEFTVPNSTTSVTPTAVTNSPFTAGSALYLGAIDGNGRVIFSNSNTVLTTVTGSGSGETTGSITSTCMSSGRGIAIDGNNNIWVANTGTSTVSVNGSNTTTYTVCEFNSAGTLISATAGYGPHNINIGRGIAVDLSGNVWVTSYSAATPFGGTAGANVTEIIGAAVPVVNPIATALLNGKMGTRP